MVAQGDCPRKYPTLLAPVCGRDGILYSNKCQADCANVTVIANRTCPRGKMSTTCVFVAIHAFSVPHNSCNSLWCYAGYTSIRCSPSPSMVRCCKDPCDGDGGCPLHPNAVCRSNICEAGTGRINGRGKAILGGPCTAVYVDPRTGTQVDCKVL